MVSTTTTTRAPPLEQNFPKKYNYRQINRGPPSGYKVPTTKPPATTRQPRIPHVQNAQISNQRAQVSNQRPQVSNQNGNHHQQQSHQKPQVSNQRPQVSNQSPQVSNQG